MCETARLLSFCLLVVLLSLVYASENLCSPVSSNSICASLAVKEGYTSYPVNSPISQAVSSYLHSWHTKGLPKQCLDALIVMACYMINPFCIKTDDRYLPCHHLMDKTKSSCPNDKHDEVEQFVSHFPASKAFTDFRRWPHSKCSGGTKYAVVAAGAPAMAKDKFISDDAVNFYLHLRDKLRFREENLVLMLPNDQFGPSNHGKQMYEGKEIFISYEGSQVRPRSLMKVLTGRRGGQKPLTLSSSKGSEPEIVLPITPDDSVILYISTHGSEGVTPVLDSQTAFFFDGRREKKVALTPTRMIKRNFFMELLSNINAGRVLIYLDFCFARNFVFPGLENGAPDIVNDFVELLDKKKSVAYLASSNTETTLGSAVSQNIIQDLNANEGNLDKSTLHLHGKTLWYEVRKSDTSYKQTASRLREKQMTWNNRMQLNTWLEKTNAMGTLDEFLNHPIEVLAASLVELGKAKEILVSKLSEAKPCRRIAMCDDIKGKLIAKVNYYKLAIGLKTAGKSPEKKDDIDFVDSDIRSAGLDPAQFTFAGLLQLGLGYKNEISPLEQHLLERDAEQIQYTKRTGGSIIGTFRNIWRLSDFYDFDTFVVDARQLKPQYDVVLN